MSRTASNFYVHWIYSFYQAKKAQGVWVEGKDLDPDEGSFRHKGSLTF